MASSYQEQRLIGAPVKSLAALGRRRLDCSKTLKQYNGKDSSFGNRMRKKADGFARGFREHLSLGAKIRESVKGKLRLGSKIWKMGSLKKVYEKMFRMKKGEEVLKASHCYLSTTAGPIAGLLFISTHNIAFSSHKSIKFSSPNGHHSRFHYKVVIPVDKMVGVNQSVNVKKASQKYIQIVTMDNFEFWFMDFLNYYSTFKCLKDQLERRV